LDNIKLPSRHKTNKMTRNLIFTHLPTFYKKSCKTEAAILNKRSILDKTEIETNDLQEQA